jgi:hypothetical protein
MFYQNDLAMRNTVDVTGGKPIAVGLQSISGDRMQSDQPLRPINVATAGALDVSAVNPLVVFYDIHGRKREVLFSYSVPDTTRDNYYYLSVNFFKFK